MIPQPGRDWILAAFAVAVVPALALGGLVGGIVVLGLGLQALVLAPHWPAVARGARFGLVRVLPSLVGWLVLVVAVDAGAGLLFDRARGVEAADVPAGSRLADADLPPTEDARVDRRAYASSPWADRYLAELERLDYDYLPSLGPRLEPVEGRYITSAHGVRRSYTPDGSQGDDAVEVWFFGGSTMWGEGQRDLHTIPSEVARLAEDEGVTLRAVNFGERGYTAYQEMQLFERELAERGPPVLAVFYDGQNELGTQQEALENLGPQPTIYQLEVWTESFSLTPALPGRQTVQEPGLRGEYAETSLVHKLWRRVSGLATVPPAGAQDPPEVAPLDEVLDNAASIYRRSVRLIRAIAERHEVPVELFFQPGQRDNTIYLELADRRPAVVHDITDAFLSVPDDDRIFIDGGHTNELGARLSAEAIWDQVRSRLTGAGT